MTKIENAPPAKPQSRVSEASLHVLGGFSLCDSSDRPIELKARKSRLLLAYLAMPAGQVRNREQLASLLWADRQDDQARGSLRTALSGIRRALGDGALIVEQDTVAQRPGILTSDYDRLRKLSGGEGTITKLDDFYTGPFLDGLDQDGNQFTDWLSALRSECTDLAIGALEKSAARSSDAGDNQSAINLLRDSLSLEPLKEATHRAIMRAYAAIGERAMALAQFRSCKELLLLELNAEPDPETKALADSIALKDVSAVHALQQGTVSLDATLGTTRVPVTENLSDNSTIAVLPFVNMSGDAEQNYFADGITEDIITDLGDIDNLSVAAKSSSQMYRGAAISPVQISRELGVRYLLEGSVRKSGQAVRISAHLMDAQTNLQIWAERYDRQLDNIFELQSDISHAIVGALKLNLAPLSRHVSDRRTTTSVEAYQCYLRGRALLRGMTRKDTELAYELFGRAVALDPNYALAYAGLADSATDLALHYPAGTDILKDALAHSERALEISPMLAEAFAARGYVLSLGQDRKGAREDLEMAIKLAPNLADAYFNLAKIRLSVTGELEKARDLFKRGFALDQEIRSAMMLLSTLNDLNLSEDRKYYANKLLKIGQKRLSLNPHDYDATYAIALAFAELGNTQDAKHWAEIALTFDPQDGRSVYNLACLHAILGSTDQCLALLERTLELGCAKIKFHFMKVTDPDLISVRKDPRFDILMARYAKLFVRSRKSAPEIQPQK